MSRVLTTAEILERQQAEMAVVAKAEDPSTLTDEDLRILPAETFTRLAAAGSLGHLGIGRPRGTRRR